MPRHRNADKNAPPAAALVLRLDAGAAAEQDAPVAWPSLARHMGKDKVGDKSGGRDNDSGPRLSREGAARQAARLERRAGALRENLRKRKAQARALAEIKPRGSAAD